MNKVFREFLRVFSLVVLNEKGNLDITDTGNTGGGGNSGPDITGGSSNKPDEAPSIVDSSTTSTTNKPTLPEGFPADLDDEIKNDPSLKVFIDKENKFNVKNLMKSYVHAQKKIGEKGVNLPDANSSEEDVKQFYNKLRPAELEKYDVKNNPVADVKINDEMFSSLKKLAHENGLTAKQAQSLIDFHNKTTSEGIKQSQDKSKEVYNKELDELKKDWGTGFENQVNIAKRAFKEFSDEKTAKYLKESGLAGNIQLIKLFNKIGSSLLTEDKFDKEAHGTFGITKDEALKKAEALRGDMNGPYWNDKHMNHKSVVEEVNKLMQVVYHD